MCNKFNLIFITLLRIRKYQITIIHFSFRIWRFIICFIPFFNSSRLHYTWNYLIKSYCIKFAYHFLMDRSLKLLKIFLFWNCWRRNFWSIFLLESNFFYFMLSGMKSFIIGYFKLYSLNNIRLQQIKFNCVGSIVMYLPVYDFFYCIV